MTAMANGPPSGGMIRPPGPPGAMMGGPPGPPGMPGAPGYGAQQVASSMQQMSLGGPPVSATHMQLTAVRLSSSSPRCVGGCCGVSRSAEVCPWQEQQLGDPEAPPPLHITMRGGCCPQRQLSSSGLVCVPVQGGMPGPPPPPAGLSGPGSGGPRPPGSFGAAPRPMPMGPPSGGAPAGERSLETAGQQLWQAGHVYFVVRCVP